MFKRVCRRRGGAATGGAVTGGAVTGLVEGVETGVVATTENLAVAIEKALAEGWGLKARLDRVRISETERNIFELEAK